MRSNYKRLGDYIRQVDVRNKDLSVTKLMGVSIQKIIMPSIANTIGTDMSTYKIVKQNQFVYGPVTSRNGDKVSIALFTEDEGIVSQAYTSFEIIDLKKLLPEYLMLWFMRPEFDRYARFMSHGSAREIFGWDEMCDVMLPVPDITVQQQIVDECNIVKNRISLNKQLIKTLEETAQAVYKQWFVDFEFPDKNGKPYKSSGGKMIDSELGEIPEGWRVDMLGNVATIVSSKRVFQDEYVSNGIPFYRGTEVIKERTGKQIDSPLFISHAHYTLLKSKYGSPQKGDILLTAVGTLGISWFVSKTDFYFKDGNVVWFKDFEPNTLNTYIYLWMQTTNFRDKITDITIGSTQNAITITELNKMNVLVPQEKLVRKTDEIIAKFISMSSYILKENATLNGLSELLLSKLSTVEV